MDSFGSDKSRPDNKSGYCKNCRAIKQKIKRIKRPYVDRNYRLLKKYGKNEQWYEETLALQGNVCAICKTNDPGRSHKFMYVDHDHDTNEVRGLLCSGCNFMLGFSKDRPEVLEQGAAYLRKYGR